MHQNHELLMQNISITDKSGQKSEHEDFKWLTMIYQKFLQLLIINYLMIIFQSVITQEEQLIKMKDDNNAVAFS